MKRCWHLVIMTIYCLCLMSQSSYAADDEVPRTYDLMMCIQSALDHHPLLNQSRDMIGYYQAGIDLAKSRFGPNISLYGDIIELGGDKNTVSLAAGGDSPMILRETSGARYAAGLVLSQPLYQEKSWFGLSAPSVFREMELLKEQEQVVDRLKLELVYGVIEDYGKTLKTLTSLRTEEGNLKSSELLFETALEKFKHDLINKADLLSAEYMLVNHKVTIERLKAELASNYATLSNKIGGDERIAAISPDIEHLSSISGEGGPLSSEKELIEMSYRLRPELKAEEAKISSLVYDLDMVRSRRYPDLQFRARYFRTGDIDFDNNANAWNLAVVLHVPLFDYGANKAETHQKERLISARKEEMQSLKNKVVMQIREDYHRVMSLKEKILGLQKSLEAARESLEVVKQKYEKQLVSELDVLKAQYTKAGIERDLYLARIDLLTGYVALRGTRGSRSTNTLSYNRLISAFVK